MFDSTKDWAKNAQSDKVPAEKLLAPRDTPAGTCTSLPEQSNSSASTFLLTDSEGEGGTVSESLSHLHEGRRVLKMLSALLEVRLHTHIAVCFSDIAWKHLLSLLFSVLPPGLFSPKPCMEYAHAQARHGREKENSQLQLTEASEGERESLGGHGRGRERGARCWEICYMREAE